MSADTKTHIINAWYYQWKAIGHKDISLMHALFCGVPEGICQAEAMLKSEKYSP